MSELLWLQLQNGRKSSQYLRGVSSEKICLYAVENAKTDRNLKKRLLVTQEMLKLLKLPDFPCSPQEHSLRFNDILLKETVMYGRKRVFRGEGL